MSATLRLGTRGSKLALTQAEWVRQRLAAAHPGLAVELVVIRTSGDRITDVPLAAVGGKGLFVKELEQALLDGSIDAAVHSLKDVPGDLAPGLVIAAVPVREAAHDVIVTRGPGGLAVLPDGARVGTSSPRRAALVRAAAPRLAVVNLRGNVDTRLAKLERGEVDALILAAAGLARLGVAPPHAVACDAAEFTPAVGQGALALESRPGAIVDTLRAIEDVRSRQAIDAERAFLVAVGGTCVTPLAAHATVDAGVLTLRAVIAQPDGARLVRGARTGAPGDGAALGTELAAALLAAGGSDILGAIPLP
ncbi:MAG: hydroxymethylbilane synthase [Deltaproteobacteria bacterium]|nr:hydroxymethylbilane synthase [Deltaproteobacteria bacterium]